MRKPDKEEGWKGVGVGEEQIIVEVDRLHPHFITVKDYVSAASSIGQNNCEFAV